MNLGYVQTATQFGHKEDNFAAVRALVAEHFRGRAIDLLVLPELFATGYAFVSRNEAARLAEPADGPTAAFLRELSAVVGGVVVAGFAESEDGKIYNSSLIVDSERILGTYRKIHLFNREKLWFDPGDLKPSLYESAGVKFGVMICFDWIFPEAMRTLMLLGADVVAHPANLVLPFCQEAMKTRCLENRMFSVTANRVGREIRGDDDFLFTGASQITAPDSKILNRAPTEGVAAESVEIDPASAADKKLNDHNDLRDDRRPGLYGELVRQQEG
ncbi:MAG TPA: nitrilase-related carbon-nitrogen hydrolase [Spirochaetia bacterium]|nr:nitrilase-related carbon-nitrogen hydrolase [Spirochaetia bacterium]